MSGWVAIARELLRHYALDDGKPYSPREAWIWLICNVAWKDTRQRVGAHTVEVPRGSMITSLQKLQWAWGWGSVKRVRTFLAMLETEEMIRTETGTGKTQITLCNYSQYQDEGHKKETQKAHEGQTKRTREQGNNTDSSLRSESKARGTRLSEDWIPGTEYIQFATGEGMTFEAAHREANNFRDYWISQPGAKGVKANWLATWRNWIRRATANAPKKQQPEQNPMLAALERAKREAAQ